MKKIRLLREAGGVGDIIRATAAATSLKKKYGSEGCWIRFYTFGMYDVIVQHCPSVDDTVSVTESVRRERDDKKYHKYEYLNDGIEWDETYDLYCPAYRHEVECQGAVFKDRIDLFCEAVNAPPVKPIYIVEKEEEEEALDWFAANNLQSQKCVAIQPFATHGARRWPVSYWKTLCEIINAHNLTVIGFDIVKRIDDSWNCVTYTKEEIQKAIALVSKCGFFVGPDSGFFHVAGILSVPTLGLFGSTSGKLMRRHYPTCAVLQATSDGLPCKTPCYGRHERGYMKDVCHGKPHNDDKTCRALAQVTPEQVWDCMRKELTRWGINFYRKRVFQQKRKMRDDTGKERKPSKRTPDKIE